MLYKLSALLLALHCNAMIHAQSLIPGTVQITAHLVNADSTTPRAMVFNFLNPFIRNRKSAAFDQDNRLSSSEAMIFTQNMTIQYNNTFINLLVAPGDSVHLVIDGARLKEKDFRWLSISGDHAIASTQLNRWHHYFTTHFNKTLQPAKSLSAMADSVRVEYRHCIAVLDSYAKQHRLLPEVVRWAKNDIRYTVSYWAVDYLTDNDGNAGQPGSNHLLYADSLFDQYDQAGFSSMMFPYHLANYAYALVKSDTLIDNLRRNMEYREATNRALKLLACEPKGLPRDYMLFNYMNNILPKSPRLIDSLPALASLFSDTLAHRYLLSAAEAIRNPLLEEKPIAGLFYFDRTGISSMPSVQVLRYFSSKYPGKVVYIDVYATWCGPCHLEMEKIPAVETQVDTAKIVFVNLCLQSSTGDWKALVKKRKFHHENYFLGEDATKLFMGMYGIEGFPTYMLLDKQGNLHTLKAPRPSDGQTLIRLLNELTK